MDPRTQRRIAQAAWGIDGVRVQGDGSLSLDYADIDPEAPLTDPGLTGPPFVGVRAFLDAVADRGGPAKFQLTGPVSLGVALAAAGLEAEVALSLAERVVGQRGRFLLGRLHGLGLGKINRVRTLVDTPAVRGMIAKVAHLVEISEG